MFQLPNKPELVVASDIHIQSPADERAKLLIQLLKEVKRVNAEALVLNGDIFDFFFGWGNYFKEKYADIFLSLEDLAAAGTKVVFIEGNHEFGLDKMAPNGVEYSDGFGKVITTSSKTTILIAHGDLMKHDPYYFTFRAIVRSWLFSSLAFVFPQKVLDQLTSSFAKISRKKDAYRTLKHEQILLCAQDTLNQHSSDHMIFGHFHHPYDHVTKNGGRILSVDSWDYPSCLVFSSGQFLRVTPQTQN
jgi:UDP-2,3-diacylglucosamine hydrolase